MSTRFTAFFLTGVMIWSEHYLALQSGPVLNDNNTQLNTTIEIQLCEPLFPSQTTSVLCFTPSTNSQEGFESAKNCTEPSLPGTIASYSCRNPRGEVFTGFLNCATSGIWLITLEHANNSLCNLDATILNFQVPDISISVDLPDFTTPAPNTELLQADFSFLNDHEIVGLQLHNVLRRNHGVPLVQMTQELNGVAQNVVNSVFGSVLEATESQLKLIPKNATMNIEMNWYFQVSHSPDIVEAVSNAVQTWYSGFLNYDWEDVEKSLDSGDALSFARVIWKSTKFIGVGLSSANNITFVVCVYTPGRDIASTDPVHEFQVNVPKFKIG